jgi:hypothetical protein
VPYVRKGPAQVQTTRVQANDVQIRLRAIGPLPDFQSVKAEYGKHELRLFRINLIIFDKARSFLDQIVSVTESSIQGQM